MALPTLHRKLFRNDGYGPFLKPEIIPFASDLASNAANVAASTAWVKDLSLPIYVDAVNGLDSNDGMSALTAFKTIGAAFASPVADFGLPIEINIAAGTYNESISIVSRNVKINLTGAVVINEKIAVRENSMAIFTGSGSLSVASSFENLVDITVNSVAIFDVPLSIDCGLSGSTASVNCLYVSYFSSCIINNGATFSANNSNGIIFTNVCSNVSIKGDIVVTGSVQNSLLYSSRNSCVYIRQGNFNASSFTCNKVFEIFYSSICLVEDETLNVRSTGFSVFDIFDNSTFRENNSDCTFTSYGTNSSVLTCFLSSTAEIYVSPGKTVKFVSSNGTSGRCISLEDNSVANLNGTGTLNITGSYDIVCSVTANSSFYLRPAMTVTGTATGKRFDVARGGVLVVNGSGANRIPGSTAGTANSTTFGYYG